MSNATSDTETAAAPAVGVSPYAATDGPNDFHWAGGGLHPGLGSDSPSLKRVSGITVADGETLGASLEKLSLAQQAIQREREAFKKEVEAFQAKQEAAASKKGKKAAP